MSRQTLATILIILIFLLIIGGMVWFFLLRAPSESTPGSQGEGGFFSRLFPGQGGDEPRAPGGDTGIDLPDQRGSDEPAPRLRLVSEAPVSGAVVFGEASSTTIRWLERATGHIYESPAATLGTGRISNETLPSVQSALWSPDGSSLAIRYLDGGAGETIKTFAGGLITEEEGGTFSYDGSFLPDNLGAAVRSPASSELAYLVDTGNGSAVFTAENDGGGVERLTISPVREWLLEWSTPSLLLMTTKPSSRALGAAYTLNTSTGDSTRMIGNIVGLTASLGPGATHLLFSESTADAIVLRRLEIDTGNVVDMPLATLPAEKCAWESGSVVYCAVPQSIPDGDYPDVWYQGRVSFADNIWRIDVSDGNASIVARLSEEAGEDIDAVDVSLSPDGSYLLFTNKNDLALWSLRTGQ